MEKRKGARLLIVAVGMGLLTLSLFLDLPTGQANFFPEKAVLENFPIYGQQHNLSCEYSATRMITAYWKQEIGEGDFINTIGFHQNPHIGFRGDIDQWFGGTWHYGIYAEPIARMLETRGFETKLLVGRDEALRQELAQGHPVQVWVIAGMGWSSPFVETYEGVPFRLAGGEHSIVIYGYDANGVYVADPAYGGRAYYGWETFLRSWSYLDYMALSFWPRDDKPNEGPIGVSNLLYRHWMVGGGMSIFGMPLEEVKVEGNKAYQYFERARLEYNLKGEYNQSVAVGLLGRELTGNRQEEKPFQSAYRSADPATLYFEPTEHNLAQGFRAFWEQNGGLPTFGYPLSEEFVEGGKIVQYFERARFEYWPNQPEAYKVQPGRVGAERLRLGR